MAHLTRERNPTEISQADFFSEAAIVRASFGKLVNCPADNVAIIPSTSYGFASALNNVKAKPNGHAITVKDEFPSGYFALESWCKDHQNDLRVIGPAAGLEQLGENWNTKILEAINDRTSVVLISAIHWMTGLRFMLKEIGEKCKAVGAILIVDGTQAVGAMEFDVQALQVDVLICASYKWLFGAYSVALAYFSDAFSEGKPIEASWMNRNNAFDFSQLANYDATMQPGAARYNVGQSSNFILMPIVREGLAQVQAWSPSGIQAYCKNLTASLRSYLLEEGFALENEAYFCQHLFAVRLPKTFDLPRLKTQLQENQVFLSMRGEYLRIATNVFNDEADIQALTACLKHSKSV